MDLQKTIIRLFLSALCVVYVNCGSLLELNDVLTIPDGSFPHHGTGHVQFSTNWNPFTMFATAKPHFTPMPSKTFISQAPGILQIPQIPSGKVAGTTHLLAPPHAVGNFYHFPRLPIGFVGFPNNVPNHSFLPLAGGGTGNVILPKSQVQTGRGPSQKPLGVLQIQPKPGTPVKGPPLPDKSLHTHAVGMVVQGPHFAGNKHTGPVVDSKHHLSLNHLFVPIPMLNGPGAVLEGPPPAVYADILIVVDASPEMGHIDPSGMVVWNPGVLNFIHELIQTTPMGPKLNRIGIVVVSFGIDDMIPFSHDKMFLQKTLKHLRPTFQGGCSQKGISTASSLFYQYGRPLAVKRIVLVGQASVKCPYRNMAEVLYAGRCGIDTVIVEIGNILGPVKKGKYQSAWIVPEPKYLLDLVGPISKRAYITPMHGGWSPWSAWNPCSASGTCSIGYQMRFRLCNNPIPHFGGRNCLGFSAETRLCHMVPCIDTTVGHWSPWSKFSQCSSPCGIGSQTRTRSCLTLAGKPSAMCKGKYVEMNQCIVKDCPVNGGWSKWSAYGLCSKTCGVGVKLRVRQCDNPVQANGGHPCAGPSVEETLCKTGVHCPINGGYSEWGPWAHCGATCGKSIQSRERLCNKPFPQFKGLPCKGDVIMTRPCDTGVPCPLHGNWGPWTKFGVCSDSCGVGIRMRERFCDSPTPSFGGEACKGLIMEEEPCETGIKCPVNGHWSEWGTFGPCSAPCGDGVMKSLRTCNNPPPLHGGAPCKGSVMREKPCVTGIPCPIDGGWSPWSKYAGCSVKCGVGIATRRRKCNNPVPQYNGLLCGGLDVHEQVCDTGVSCPVHGFWSHWQPWGPCSVSCHSGIRQRRRICDNPSPKFGGLSCKGSPVSEERCNTKIPCPVAGGWSGWSLPLPCPKKCGIGMTKRVRECNSPPPMYGGPDCFGPNYEAIECNTGIMCPIDGDWSPWGKWSICDKQCGMGKIHRNRLCNNPTPMYKGFPCKGPAKESQQCDSGIMCPVDGYWSGWGPWTLCSESCGTGFITRTRICDSPAPAYGGHPCKGPDIEKDICNTKIMCPIDGGWSPWSELSPCSVTCGAGVMHRSRLCNNPPANYNGLPCKGYDTEKVPCDTDVHCPIHGNWGPWSKPSTCSVACGSGVMTRSRVCDDPAPMYGGELCSGDHVQKAPCDTGIFCPIDGGWSYWSEFSPCKVPCGVGIVIRTRTCTVPVPNYGGKSCKGIDVEEKVCNVGRPCPIDGNWSPWTAYGQCSTTCGTGFMQRQRKCNNPSPMYGGANCFGLPLETSPCDTNIPCPINGGWTEWGGYGKCSVTCGVGLHMKTRKCVNPVPMYNGIDCKGLSVFEEPCDTGIPCPVHGMWTAWSEWGACSVACGSGVAIRDRECANPPPLYGGMPCKGAYKEKTECNTGIYCPIHGGWGPWGKYSVCSVKCGVGVKQRDRVCNNPVPQYGGKLCYGDLIETEVCDTRIPCPINGGFSQWSKWSLCKATCGDGVQTRVRSCDSPPPAYGGADCDGLYKEEQICYSGVNCPIDGNWGSWSAYAHCSVTCGVGIQERSRVCDNPVPMYKGMICKGDAFDFQLCDTGKFCPVNGGWSIWTLWSECSVSCGVGGRSRVRTCTNPAPRYGGLMCSGENKQGQVCSTGLPCAIHGGWSTWSVWTDCSASCGEGRRTRMRECDEPEPQFGGLPCKGYSKESIICKAKVRCPIDGEWDSWEPWAKCAGPCGIGKRERNRYCEAPPPQYGGRDCKGLQHEYSDCDTMVPCAVDGGWSRWSMWGACITKCGMGYQIRSRACMDPEPMYGGKPCIGIYDEKRDCKSNIPCPVDGNWSPWSVWDKCQGKCGMGFHYRGRMCTNPKPLFGGKPCKGYHEEKRSCDTGIPCPIHGGWSGWAAWDYCDGKCGKGVQVRIRTCTQPRPLFGGQLCKGTPQERRVCDTGRPCAINGNWGMWTVWSMCEGKCGYGKKIRVRECDSPPPQYGGQPCHGFRKEMMKCDTGRICTRKGGWTLWGMWTACSATCGTGIQIRQRACTNPVPIGPGMVCDGYGEESRICNTKTACPIHGQWSSWSMFGACFADCRMGPPAHGVKVRKRVCNNPVPQNGGMPCVGDFLDKQPCMDFPPCPMPVWGLWSKWSKCSAVCGPGETTRVRECIDKITGKPVIGCMGPDAEILPCIDKPCPLHKLNCSTECKWDNGIGYANYPGDCSLFVQCDSLYGTPKVHKCPWGLLWSLEILQCVFPDQSECQVCKVPGEKVAYHISCRAYWLCNGEVPVPMCCPEGHMFDPFEKHCVEDVKGRCNEPCQPVQRVYKERCTFKASTKGRFSYQEEINGLWVERPCGQGTVFSEKDCRCIHHDGEGFLGIPVQKVCKPALDMKFTSLEDDLKRNVGLHIQGVQYLGDGTALFDGNAAINSNIFSNSEWGTEVYVYIRFKPDMKTGKQGLIHNSGCGPSDIGPSVFIGFDTDGQSIKNKNINMKFATVPKKKTLQYEFVNMTVPSQQMLDAWFEFGKGHFTAEVNGLKAQLMIDGSQVARRHGALNIGGNLCRIGNEAFQGFKGILDEVRIYKCKPSRIII